MKRAKWAAAAGAALLFVVGLGSVMFLVWPAVAEAHVYGTSNADTIVYGRIYHWAVPEGGGGSWRYDGEGGCVYAYTSTSPYRGTYLYHQDHEWGNGWAVYGMMGDDMIYSPSLYDSGSLVCGTPPPPSGVKVETDTVNRYETNIYGDEGSASAGGGDTIYGCPSWHCHMYGDGGGDGIAGGTAGDYIFGGDGADLLLGGAGDDDMDGWNGDDWLYGHGGYDIILGWYGIDRLFGGDDPDILDGEYDADLVHGEGGNDECYGGDGNDYVYGEAGTDVCHGGNGTDYCGTAAPYYCETPLYSCSTGGS